MVCGTGMYAGSALHPSTSGRLAVEQGVQSIQAAELHCVLVWTLLVPTSGDKDQRRKGTQ